jgi:hypothetical protein
MADEIELLRLVSELIPEPTTDAWARAKAAIAAAREEDQLRQDTKRSTRDLRPPVGVAWRHRRRLALRSAAVIAAALTAGAVVLAITGVPGGRHDGTSLTAYVVKRVGSALSAAEPAEIAEMRVTTSSAMAPGGASTTEVWSYGDQWRAAGYSPAGDPVYDEGFSTATGFTLVSYRAGIWARLGALGRAAGVRDPRSCGSAAVLALFGPGLPGSGFSASSPPATAPRALLTAVSCEILTDAGHQRVNGIDAIELTSAPDSKISETIWVSPGTYLPVRVVVRSAADTSALPQTVDITWLPATAPNLAKLTVPVPAGFGRVPLNQAVWPIIQRTLGHQ